MIRARLAASAAVLLLALVGAPVGSQTGAVTRAIPTARSTLRAMVTDGRTPGVSAAVAVDGRIVWAEAFGMADIEGKVPAIPDTRFGLGSISKVLTMTAVVRLADKGVIELDAPVETYLPNFRHAGKGITIRRLAAHQSGLSDRFANDNRETRVHVESVEAAYQAIIREAALTHPPGSKVEYATGLYTIIARSIEAAAGDDYLRIMDREVFAPLVMTSVAPNDPRQAMPDRTRFYVEAPGGGFVPGPHFDPSHKLAGAGFVATARDVASFGAGLLREGYLSAQGRRDLFTRVSLSDGSLGEYAPGFLVDEYAGKPRIHLPGGGIGISAWLFIHPDDRLVIALLANVPTAPVGGRTHRTIADAFLSAIAR
jgi:serine beta-lactamase-like protein LACTB, mitochondrial